MGGGRATPTGLISVQLAGLQLDENMHVVILAGDNKREQLSARPPFEGDSARLSCVDSWMSAAQLNCRSLQPCWKVAAAHIKRGRLELGIRDSSFQSGDFEEGGDLKQTGWRALQDQTWFRGLVLLCFFFFFFLGQQRKKAILARGLTPPQNIFRAVPRPLKSSSEVLVAA